VFDLDLADVKPSVMSWLIVGIMAITFILVMKWLMAKFPIPGLVDAIQAV
jgi:hypothetical protein